MAGSLHVARMTLQAWQIDDQSHSCQYKTTAAMEESTMRRSNQPVSSTWSTSLAQSLFHGLMRRLNTIYILAMLHKFKLGSSKLLETRIFSSSIGVLCDWTSTLLTGSNGQHYHTIRHIFADDLLFSACALEQAAKLGLPQLVLHTALNNSCTQRPHSV